MITLLLDTNVVSELARPVPHPAVEARVAGSERQAAISSVTWHELLFGVARMPSGRRRDALTAFVDDLVARFPVLPYDRAAAEWHAAERARLEASGRARPFADSQIAAIAVTNDLRLVTRNDVDFAGFEGLVVENWWLPG